MDQYTQLLPILMVFGVFYFLIIRPQQQEQKALDQLRAGLAKDDRVVLGSGVHGKVVSVKDDTVVLEVGKGVHLTVDKVAVARREGDDAGDEK